MTIDHHHVLIHERLPSSGFASIYSDWFDGRKTSNGEIFRQNGYTAALLPRSRWNAVPLGTRVELTTPVTLWQSAVDLSYSPRISFIADIAPQGVPLALVVRQTGAASSELDVIGNARGQFGRILELDGFKFDIQRLDSEALPSIIVHLDANLLDVPQIYAWNDGRFVDASGAHPAFYRHLLSKDKIAVPRDASGAVLLRLSKIAALAGDPGDARKILHRALTQERSRGNAADPEVVHSILRALNRLGQQRHGRPSRFN